MDKLIAKEVEFNGDILKAAQDPDGNIWVGARWVCEAIGLDDNRIKYERRKMQTDSVISKGVQNFTLLTNGGNQNVMCLQLDYLPLWLAKISITPTMKKEMPGIAEKLVAYQLKAKEEDNGRYMWSTDMITPLGDLYEAIQSRRHSSDSSMG